MTDIDLNWSKF